MEALLATTMTHSPDFDPALALGRIHGILSALIQHCKTRAGYLYTGCFTCELEIRSRGNACVPPVVVNRKAKAELLQVWKVAREMDGALAPQRSPPLSPGVRLAKTTGPSVASDVVFQPLGSASHLLSWTIIAPFALYCAFNIYHNVIWKILPIAAFIFQTVFFPLALFVLLFSHIFCTTVVSPQTVQPRA